MVFLEISKYYRNSWRDGTITPLEVVPHVYSVNQMSLFKDLALVKIYLQSPAWAGINQVIPQKIALQEAPLRIIRLTKKAEQPWPFQERFFFMIRGSGQSNNAADD